MAILRCVVDIVDRVQPGRKQAEGATGKRDPDRHIVVRERAGGTRRGDDERVLGPLSWAEGG